MHLWRTSIFRSEEDSSSGGNEGRTAPAATESRTVPEGDRARMSGLVWAQLVVGLGGFLAAAEALRQKLLMLKNPNQQLMCDINDKVNCSKVIGSDFGEIFGIPLGAFGMAFWAVVLGVTLLPLTIAVTRRWIAGWRLFVGTVGLAAAAALLYIVTFLLPSACVVCAIVQVLCVVYFLLALVDFVRSPKMPMRNSFTAFSRLALVTALVAIFPIIVGYFMTSAARAGSPAAAKTETPAPAKVDTADFEKMPKDGIYKQTGNHSVGNPAAPIQVMVFTDIECPYCQRFHFRVHEIIKDVGPDNMHFIFRNWPLPFHQYAARAAMAARCAGRQGKFWEYVDWAYQTMANTANNDVGRQDVFSQGGLVRRAGEMGLDRSAFSECLYSRAEQGKVDEDAAQAQKLGGKGTPFILVDGKPYEGDPLTLGVMEKELKAKLK